MGMSSASQASKVTAPDDADRAGAPDGDPGERDEHPVGDLRAQRPPVQLVEGVRADPDGEGERGDGGAEPVPGDDRRQAAADDDVGQMPGRVGRMQQRHVVPPAAALQRVPGRDRAPRARRRGSCLPSPDDDGAPKLSRRTSTPCRPAACHHSSWRSSGWRPRSRGSTRRGSRRPRASRAGAGGRRAAAPRGRRGPRAGERDPRDAELERGDDAARTHHARELGQRRPRVGDVAKQIGQREVVEGLRSERERLRRRIDQLDRVAEATVGDRQHLGALIDAGHLESPPQELRRDQPRPGRHIEDVAAARQARDEEAAPARVLSQRERGADAVVRRPERGEQLAGVLLQSPRWHPSRHPPHSDRRTAAARLRAARRAGKKAPARAMARPITPSGYSVVGWRTSKANGGGRLPIWLRELGHQPVVGADPQRHGDESADQAQDRAGGHHHGQELPRGHPDRLEDGDVAGALADVEQHGGEHAGRRDQPQDQHQDGHEPVDRIDSVVGRSCAARLGVTVRKSGSWAWTAAA